MAAASSGMSKSVKLEFRLMAPNQRNTGEYLRPEVIQSVYSGISKTSKSSTSTTSSRGENEFNFNGGRKVTRLRSNRTHGSNGSASKSAKIGSVACSIKDEDEVDDVRKSRSVNSARQKVKSKMKNLLPKSIPKPLFRSNTAFGSDPVGQTARVRGVGYSGSDLDFDSILTSQAMQTLENPKVNHKSESFNLRLVDNTASEKMFAPSSFHRMMAPTQGTGMMHRSKSQQLNKNPPRHFKPLQSVQSSRQSSMSKKHNSTTTKHHSLPLVAENTAATKPSTADVIPLRHNRAISFAKKLKHRSKSGSANLSFEPDLSRIPSHCRGVVDSVWVDSEKSQDNVLVLQMLGKNEAVEAVSLGLKELTGSNEDDSPEKRNHGGKTGPSAQIKRFLSGSRSKHSFNVEEKKEADIGSSRSLPPDKNYRVLPPFLPISSGGAPGMGHAAAPPPDDTSCHSKNLISKPVSQPATISQGGSGRGQSECSPTSHSVSFWFPEDDHSVDTGPSPLEGVCVSFDDADRKNGDVCDESSVSSSSSGSLISAASSVSSECSYHRPPATRLCDSHRRSLSFDTPQNISAIASPSSSRFFSRRSYRNSLNSGSSPLRSENYHNERSSSAEWESLQRSMNREFQLSQPKPWKREQSASSSVVLGGSSFHDASCASSMASGYSSVNGDCDLDSVGSVTSEYSGLTDNVNIDVKDELKKMASEAMQNPGALIQWLNPSSMTK